MDEEFDPLSLFTPLNKVDEELYVVDAEFKSGEKNAAQHQLRNEVDINQELEDASNPIHFLDLPLLQLNPPDPVILLILKLLAPDQVLNFAPHLAVTNEEVEVVPSTVFDSKNVSALVPYALPWLKTHCPRFDSETKLAYLPSLRSSFILNFGSNYNSWLTKIISSDKYSDDVLKQASLRVSENCGRTAQPEIIRKIKISNLDKHISLKEPSLTSDNLGLKTWGSSLILSSRLVREADKHNLVEPILELGSGTGLVGLVSSILGYKTMLTDLKEIISNLQDNVKLNGLTDLTRVDELDWSNPSSFIDKHNSSHMYNTILISDPIYLSQHPYWVVDMLKLFLSEFNPQALVHIQIPLRPKYEQERKLLWDLLEPDFEVVLEEIENGFDDFGEMNFCYKQLKRRR